MTDLEQAKANLMNHSIALCKGNSIITREEKGIAPMMHLIADGVDLQGYAVADVIVGKAAAMLFCKAGIQSVFGKVMSQAGKAFLEQKQVPCAYETLTEKIINRNGTDVCPMEKTVANIDDVEEAYSALQNTLAELKRK